jgi:hypothetical protein
MGTGWTMSATVIGRRTLPCLLVGARWPQRDVVRALPAHIAAARSGYEGQDDNLSGDVRSWFGLLADPERGRYDLTFEFRLGAPSPCPEQVVRVPCDRQDASVLAVGRLLMAGAPVLLDARRSDGVSTGRPLRALDLLLGKLLILDLPVRPRRAQLLYLLGVAELGAAIRGHRLPLCEAIRSGAGS